LLFAAGQQVIILIKYQLNTLVIVVKSTMFVRRN
jgi:hypothetical protein